MWYEGAAGLSPAEGGSLGVLSGLFGRVSPGSRFKIGVISCGATLLPFIDEAYVRRQRRGGVLEAWPVYSSVRLSVYSGTLLYAMP